MTFKKTIKTLLLNSIWSFDSDNLIKAIHKLGVKSGDTLMVHNSWRNDSGFKGSPQDIIQAFIDSVGPDGTVCMMSMPFQGMSAAEYLETHPIFDVKKTISMVGLITEIFRRKKGVIRSLHPTHSVAAIGKNAEFLIRGHETCSSPFGKNSPFDKLSKINGKILLYDVKFNSMTYEHYLEDVVEEKIGINLYDDHIFDCQVKAYNNENISVQTKVLSQSNNKKRDSEQLFNILSSNNCLNKTKIGRIEILLIDAVKSKTVISDLSIQKSPFHK